MSSGGPSGPPPPLFIPARGKCGQGAMFEAPSGDRRSCPHQPPSELELQPRNSRLARVYNRRLGLINSGLRARCVFRKR